MDFMMTLRFDGKFGTIGTTEFQDQIVIWREILKDELSHLGFPALKSISFLCPQAVRIHSPDITGSPKVEAYRYLSPRQLSVTKCVTLGVLTSFNTDPPMLWIHAKYRLISLLNFLLQWLKHIPTLSIDKLNNGRSQGWGVKPRAASWCTKVGPKMVNLLECKSS